MKFSEVTRKMVEQLRKKAGFEEQVTEEGPPQGRNKPNEGPDAQKIGDRGQPRATRPQGKGRREGRDLQSQLEERGVSRNGQQRRGPPIGPRTAHESARQSRGNRVLTRERQEKHDEDKERTEKVQGQEQVGGGNDEPATSKQKPTRAKGRSSRRRRRRSNPVGNTRQRGNGTSSTATLRSVGERTKDGNCPPDRKEGEGLAQVTPQSPWETGTGHWTIVLRRRFKTVGTT